MRVSRVQKLLLTILTASICVIPIVAHAPNRSEQLARTVTIYRDTYGVPHVFGRSDASTVFGFAYAQAEDNFWRVEENFIHALGRASELYGQKSLNEDRLNHALEIPKLAREEYARLDRHMRLLCDSFAEGFNYYIARHPKEPRLLTRIEPWYTLAFIRYNYYQNGFARDRNLRQTQLQTAALEAEELKAHTGSNGWAIGPSKSATATRCFLSTLIFPSSVPVRFMKVMFIAMKDGTSRAIRGSDFLYLMSDTTKMAVG